MRSALWSKLTSNQPLFVTSRPFLNNFVSRVGTVAYASRVDHQERTASWRGTSGDVSHRTAVDVEISGAALAAGEPPSSVQIFGLAALAPSLCRPLFPLLSFAFPVIVLLGLALRSCYRHRRRCCCAKRRRVAGGRGTGQHLRVGGASPDEVSGEQAGGEAESKKGR